MGAPARFLTGLGTQASVANLGDYPLPDPHQTAGNAGLGVCFYETDYMDLGSAASRTITGTSSTFAQVDGVGGRAVLTPGGATTASAVYRTAAAFQFIAGQKLWFRAKGAVSALTPTAQVGLIKTGAAATDSLLFKMAAGGAVSLVSTVNSVATTLLTLPTPLVAATDAVFGFYYDGTDLRIYLNDVIVGRATAVTIGASGTTLTNALLTPYLQITPTVTETISLDYLLMAQEVTGR